MRNKRKSVLIYAECPMCGNGTLWCNYVTGTTGYEYQCLDCAYETSQADGVGCHEQRQDYERYNRTLPDD